jgi:glycine/serine hydroxymethyltransferase
MMEIADLIDEALSSHGDASVLEKVRQQVRALTAKYPLPG